MPLDVQVPLLHVAERLVRNGRSNPETANERAEELRVASRRLQHAVRERIVQVAVGRDAVQRGEPWGLDRVDDTEVRSCGERHVVRQPENAVPGPYHGRVIDAVGDAEPWREGVLVVKRGASGPEVGIHEPELPAQIQAGFGGERAGRVEREHGLSVVPLGEVARALPAEANVHREPVVDLPLVVDIGGAVDHLAGDQTGGGDAAAVARAQQEGSEAPPALRREGVVRGEVLIEVEDSARGVGLRVIVRQPPHVATDLERMPAPDQGQAGEEGHVVLPPDDDASSSLTAKDGVALHAGRRNVAEVLGDLADQGRWPRELGQVDPLAHGRPVVPESSPGSTQVEDRGWRYQPCVTEHPLVRRESLGPCIDMRLGTVWIDAEGQVVPPSPAPHEPMLGAGIPVHAIVELGVVPAIACVCGVVVVELARHVGLVPKMAQGL